MGVYDLTDGVWVWPQGLHHYVSEHNIRLPEKFIQTMEQNDFQVPDLEIDFNDIVEMNFTFWINWCRKGV